MDAKKTLSAIFLLVIGTSALSMELIQGYGRSEIPKNIKKQMWNSEGGPFIADGLVESSKDGQYYWLFRSLSISLFDTATSKNLSAWPLTPWENQAVLAGESAAAADVLNGEGVYEESYGNTYWKVTDPAELKTGSNVVWENRYVYLDSKKHYGCLANTPLRHGDIDGGTPELVLFIEKNIHIFSPSSGKTVFEFNWFNSDEISEEGLANLKDPAQQDHLYKPYQTLGADAPQYPAASGRDKYVNAIYKGWRSFAKVFISDFDKNGQPDIVMWRKLYSSRLVGDAMRGFQLNAQNWIHYQLVDGAYIPQDTTPETIQNWLASANLTWSKGFPSVSECPGEEGKLIPEMHDPLLNDPDVLK